MSELLLPIPKAIEEQAKPKKHITEAQCAARRANARRAKEDRATGPRTAPSPRSANAKFRSSLNSLRHGAYAKTFTLKTEDQARFQSVIDDYIANFAPQSYAELEFIEQMATASWRRRRIATIINEKINQAIDTVFAQIVQPTPEPISGPREFTVSPFGNVEPVEALAAPESQSDEPQPDPTITPEALTELAYEHIARTQPSFYRLESAERLAAASFRAAFRGLQNYRAFLEQQQQREERRNEATDSVLFKSADASF